VLKEIRNVRQEPGAGRRRWFESDGFELVVWQNQAGAWEGFQVCYNLGQGEHALTWRPGVGFAHSVVDGGDDTPFANQTPILVPDGAVPWAEIGRLFGERALGIDAELRELVRTRLADRK
jgi:hypothetical protein